MDATLEFVGTATTILRLGPHALLTDPDFRPRGRRAYLGKGLFSKRRTQPALGPDDLPPIEGVVLSHLHGDHFDPVARERLAKDLPVVTTPAAGRKLGSWGFREARGMRSWETASLGEGLTITSVPGEHAPSYARRLLPPVMGSVLEVSDGGGTPFRVYISGDTLFRPWLREVTERAGPLDAMVIHLGGTRILGLLVTMDGDQGADLVDLLAPPVTIPIHYDDYTVFRSPLGDFLRTVRARGHGDRVRTVARGETISLLPA